MTKLNKILTALSQKPGAIFTVCMTLAMRNGERNRPATREWVSPVRSIVRPLSEGYLGVFQMIRSR